MRLVPKVMREAHQLQAQLGDMLRQIFPSDPLIKSVEAAPPPSGSQAKKLRRCLAASLPDRVARLASLCDSPREQQLLLELSKDVKPVLLRRAYLAAEQGRGQLLWLRPGSRLAITKPRPQYVCFFEVRCPASPVHLVAITHLEDLSRQSH